LVLLHNDRAFEPFVTHLGFRVADNADLINLAIPLNPFPGLDVTKADVKERMALRDIDTKPFLVQGWIADGEFLSGQ